MCWPTAAATAPATPITALLRRSRFTVVVTGSSLRAVRATARVAAQLRAELGMPAHDIAVDDDESLGLLVVGPDRPYSVEEIEDGCQAEVVGTLPYDAGRGAGVDRRRPPGPVVSPVGAARAPPATWSASSPPASPRPHRRPTLRIGRAGRVSGGVLPVTAAADGRLAETIRGRVWPGWNSDPDRVGSGRGRGGCRGLISVSCCGRGSSRNSPSSHGGG